MNYETAIWVRGLIADLQLCTRYSTQANSVYETPILVRGPVFSMVNFATQKDCTVASPLLLLLLLLPDTHVQVYLSVHGPGQNIFYARQ